MSLIKRAMEDAEARGWSNGPDKTVCDRHVEDDALERLIAERAEETTCSYCERTEAEPFAAPLDVLIERIGTSLPHEWRNADDEGCPGRAATSERPTTPTTCSPTPSATFRSITAS